VISVSHDDVFKWFSFLLDDANAPKKAGMQEEWISPERW
jgi:hypothetical protein